MIDRAPALSIPKRLLVSAITALVVVLVAHLVTLIEFFTADRFSNAALVGTNGYFLPVSLVALVITFALALAGGFRHWYLAIPTGLIAGILAGLLGTTLSVTQTGRPLTTEVVQAIFGTLGGVNLIFVLAMVVSASTLGLTVWRRLLASRLFGAIGPREPAVLVRLPAANLSEGQVTHIARTPIDADLADEQWDAYVDVLAANGWDIVEVEPATDLADSVFVEDAVVMFGTLAVLTHPGAESRRGEIAGVERAVQDLGLQTAHILGPGTLDGGDVLKVGSTVYVGRGGRTNGDGIRQLRALVAPLGYNVVAVPITKVLHLKSAVTALPDGTIIGFPPLVDDPTVFDRFLPVPEESGSHVVVLSDTRVLMAASAPQTAELIRELGYTVVTVDISEYEKLEGCVTCLSVRIR